MRFASKFEAPYMATIPGKVSLRSLANLIAIACLPLSIGCSSDGPPASRIGEPSSSIQMEELKADAIAKRAQRTTPAAAHARQKMPVDSTHAPFAHRGQPTAAHAGVPGGAKKAEPATDDHALPLATGPHSPAADLERGRTSIADEAARANFESGYRKTFTADRSKRDYATAKQLLEGVLGAHASHAQTLRALGYVAVNQGFQVDLAVRFYAAAIEADPKYGGAHYAMAFMLGRSDATRGATHFRTAMELGIPDTRGIGPRFYPDAIPVEPKPETSATP